MTALSVKVESKSIKFGVLARTRLVLGVRGLVVGHCNSNCIIGLYLACSSASHTIGIKRALARLSVGQVRMGLLEV
eukprot:683936-Amphidinium_carterae.1